MALKFVVVVSLILALFMAQAPPMQAQVVPTVISVVQVVLANLRNTITGLPIANTTSPIFSGALVQVRVGTTPLAVGVTDATGSVNITLTPTLLGTTLDNLVNNLVSSGTVRILTPVLNTTTGLLNASLQLIGNITTPILRIVTVGPGGFTLQI